MTGLQKNFIFLSTFSFLAYFLLSEFATMSMRDLNFSNEQLGTVISTYRSSYSFCALAAVFLSKMMKRSTLVAFVSILSGVGLIGPWLLSNPSGLYFMLATISLAGLIYAIFEVTMVDIDKKTSAMALTIRHMAVNVLLGAGIFLLPVLYGKKVEYAYALIAALMVLSMIAGLWVKVRHSSVIDGLKSSTEKSSPIKLTKLLGDSSSDGVKLKLVMVFLLSTIISSLCYNQVFFSFITHHMKMNLDMGFMKVGANQIQFVEPVWIIILTPLMANMLFGTKAMAKNRNPVSYAMLYPILFLPIFIYMSVSEYLLAHGHSISIWYDVVMYGAFAAGEVIKSIYFTQFALENVHYDHRFMIKFIMRLCDFLATLLCVACVKYFKIFDAVYFAFFAVLLVLNIVILWLIAKRFAKLT